MVSIWAQYISLSVGKSDEMKMIDCIYPYNKNIKTKTSGNGNCKDHQMIIKSKILQDIKGGVIEGHQFHGQIKFESGSVTFMSIKKRPHYVTSPELADPFF